VCPLQRGREGGERGKEVRRDREGGREDGMEDRKIKEANR
jgi:hypothetical protein